MTNATANKRQALIVRDPFNNYKRGDQINDPQLISEILNSQHAIHVNRILLPEIQQIKPEPVIEPQLISQPASKASKKSKE